MVEEPIRLTRRQLLQGVSLLMVGPAGAAALGASDYQGEGPQSSTLQRNEHVEYGKDTLPTGIRSRTVDNNNGVTMHVLEAGFEGPASYFCMVSRNWGTPGETSYCLSPAQGFMSSLRIYAATDAA